MALGLRRYAAQLGCLSLAALLAACTLTRPYAVERYIRYPVKSGDTLSAIAERFEVDTQELRTLNVIADPAQLVPGTELKIPYHGQSTARTAADLKAAEKLLRPAPAKAARAAISPAAARYIGVMAKPVPGAKLYSPFGTRAGNFHEGVDLSAASGTAIYAAHDGEVVYSGSRLRGYGNLIVLRGDGILTVYAHNRKNYVDSGDSVKRGEKIAEVGSTGKANGPHCHFEVRVKNGSGLYQALDPSAFFPGGIH